MITICVPTMPQRHSTLSRLLHVLQPWVGPDLEVLIHPAVAPMGDKLNEMFACAAGSHVVCVDDDDVIHPGLIPDRNYLVDFVGWHILVSIDGTVAGTVEHRLGQDPYAVWADHRRGVSPKCLVSTDIARQVTFGNEYTADRAWSTEVQALCRTGTFVDQIVYHYDHWRGSMLGTEPDARPDARQRDIGAWSFDREAFTWLA